MNISKYMALAAAAEYGSFTKAAEILNYSQSAVSRMIRDIEDEWGISVLERSKNGVQLTSDGLKIMPYVKNLCSEYESLKMQISEINGLESGIIRIGTFSSAAEHWLPNIIKRFQKDYPNIDYELLIGDYTETENYIAEGRVDFGFLRLPVKTELETMFLAQDRFVAVLPENHYLASKEKVSAADLCGEPFLMLKKDSNDEVSGIFDKCGLSPNVKFTTWDDYAIMSMVEYGLGVSILPELILKRTPYRLVLKALDMPAYRSIGLAMRSKRALPLAAQKFLEYLD